MDKLFLPGLLKLAMLRKSGFFGRLLAVRSEFGYWVFEGDLQPTQRPSWNYRAEDGGGIILDMLCHWRYVLDHLFGAVKSLTCLGATHIPKRWDEAGKPYDATAEDAAFATFQLEDRASVIAQINSSWVTRVYRDDLVTFQVDGTHGSAVAGLHDPAARGDAAAGVEPGREADDDFRADWQEVPDTSLIQTASAGSGRCSSGTSPRTRPGVTARRGREGCPAGRGGAAELEGAAPGSTCRR